MTACRPLVFTTLCTVFWIAGATEAIRADEKDVRSIPFKPADPTAIFRYGGQSKVILLKDAAATEEMVGKGDAKKLNDQVDFAKEQLVFVSWTTSGPPEGKLKNEIKGEGENRQLVFYVQAPPGANARGQRARIGGDFFAAPKGLKVIFEPTERR